MNPISSGFGVETAEDNMVAVHDGMKKKMWQKHLEINTFDRVGI